MAYMYLALKYILVLFIICSCECHVNRPHFLSCSWRCKGKKDWGHKKGGCCECLWLFQETQQTSMDSRTSYINCWYHKSLCASIKIVLMTNISMHSQSSSFVKRFFSELWWLYSCLKLQKTRPDYYFNNNELMIVIIEHLFI